MYSVLNIAIKDKIASFEITNPLKQSRILIGKTPDAVLKSIPIIFNLCPMAHKMAASLALGLPVDEIVKKGVIGEIIREHSMIIFNDISKILGLGLLREALIGINNLNNARLEKLENDLFGTRAEDFINNLSNSGIYGEILPRLDEFIGDFGAIKFESDPTYYARAKAFGDNPFFTKVPTLSQRILSRFWEVANLIISLKTNSDIEISGVKNNSASVWAARGLLTHSYTQNAGIISDCTITTPTNQILESGGMLLKMLNAALNSERYHIRELVLMNICTIDPCIETKITGLE
ncbi:hypothetical protein [Pseudaquidulcibacter saccharophilus]|uniref:hypothetical protein n=1 Tax=Pseudaquidulcibacter saccharophilus TaxID=2831900 RepID=UPI001EFF49A5|nr:hypothetical protein [Pseudaquidulcibacter saccharophilus]